MLEAVVVVLCENPLRGAHLGGVEGAQLVGGEEHRQPGVVEGLQVLEDPELSLAGGWGSARFPFPLAIAGSSCCPICILAWPGGKAV